MVQECHCDVLDSSNACCCDASLCVQATIGLLNIAFMHEDVGVRVKEPKVMDIVTCPLE